jgi:hypothetical protein
MLPPLTSWSKKTSSQLIHANNIRQFSLEKYETRKYETKELWLDKLTGFKSFYSFLTCSQGQLPFSNSLVEFWVLGISVTEITYSLIFDQCSVGTVRELVISVAAILANHDEIK